MGLKRGYKQTEVGVIPEDWEVQPLGPSCEIITKGTTPTTSGRAFIALGVAFLKAESISERGKTIADKMAFIDDATHALLKRSQLSEGDVLISIAGVLGRVGLVEKSDLPANTNQALAIVRLGKNADLLRGFLFYCLRSSVVAKQIRDITVQAAQANISLQNVRDFLLPLPPTKAEQEAIAEALSDADALIESLGQVLAKKRQLRQGAMQELLTGKKRLPGFSGEWEVRPLGAEVTALDAGVSVNSTDVAADLESGDAAILKTSCVDRGVFTPTECKRIASKDVCRAKLNPRADTILISRMNTIDLVGECGYVDADYPCLFVPDRLWMTRFRKNSETSAKWLNYILSSEHYRTLLKAAATGTSGSMKNIAKGTLLSLDITFPPILEQTAIAAILSDMDAEITAIGEKLTKARQLKQGMMQELLTGRIRLV